MLNLKENPRVFPGYIHGVNLPILICKLSQDGDYPKKLDELLQNLTTSNWQDVSAHFSNHNLKLFISLFLSICKKLRIPVTQPIVHCEIDHRFELLIPYVYLNPTALTISLALDTLSELETLVKDNHDFIDIQNHMIKRLEIGYQKIRPLVDPGLNNYFIIDAAIRSGIPHQAIANRAWRLGHGQKARIFFSTITDQTPAWSVKTAKNKQLTAGYLNSLGLPGAQHVIVEAEAQLFQAIQKIGYPLVIKPLDAEQGNGVSAHLIAENDVLIAFKNAQKYSKLILVERHQSGFTHRITLLNHRVIKVVKRIAGGVTGDGHRSIEELVDAIKKSADHQRKAERRGKALLSLDDEALSLLRQYNLTPKYIPPSGAYIRLRRRDNINAGGSNQIIPIELIHSDNIQLAIDVSKNLNFDIVGVDLIIDDITQSWLLTGATICEVNAQPQLGANHDPDLYPMILEELLSNKGLIPVDLIIKSYSVDLTTHSQNILFSRAVLSDKSGLYHNKRLITKSFANDFLAARAGLAWKAAAEVVCCLSYDDLLKQGLPLYHGHVRHIYHAKEFTQADELVRLFHFSRKQFKLL